MQLVEQHIISKNHQFYQECDRVCFLSKKLYNAALYTIKKKYGETCAANILRKEIPRSFDEGIEGLVVNPIKLKSNF